MVEVDHFYEEWTLSRVQAPARKTLMDMFQLGNSSASGRIKMTSAMFLETILFAFLSRMAVDNAITE